jgi:hypothetical protein
LGGGGEEVSFKFSVLSEARKDISDQISAIRRQEKDYTEVAEDIEFTEKRSLSARSEGGGGGGLGFMEVDGVVLDAAVVGGEEFEGFLGDDGGFAIGTGKAIDGLEGGPQGLDDEVDDDTVGLRDDAGFAEAVEGAQVREDVFPEVAQVIGETDGGGACGPEANDHVRRLLRWIARLADRGQRRRSTDELSNA